MKTGQHLKIRRMGDKVLGVKLYGDPSKPEPTHFRVTLPGGDVDIARCTDGSYWVHVTANHPKGGLFNPGEDTPGQFLEARIHRLGANTSDADFGDFDKPDVYDVALRLAVSQ